MTWQIITGEYPPQTGGVSDYTQLVAVGLATADEEVHVWCPSSAHLATDAPEDEAADSAGVSVHREFGRLTPADLSRVGKMLDQFSAPRRLLVQWVPHGYGYRSMNLWFCLWLWWRAKFKCDRIEIMVHEPFLAFGQGSMKQDLAATVHRVMIAVLLSAARRVWISIPNWEAQLRPFALGQNKSFGWLPVPSNIPVMDDADGVIKVRDQYSTPNGRLVGHFGAYDRYMMELMLELLPSLLRGQSNLSVILLGKGSIELRERVIERHPELSQHVSATGALTGEKISTHISACDLMLQPYQDGVSGRRTSVMTALSHGVPVVTTIGKATESCWAESDAVKLTKVGDISSLLQEAKGLLADAPERGRLCAAGKALYEACFDVKRVITRLREVVE